MKRAGMVDKVGRSLGFSRPEIRNFKRNARVTAGVAGFLAMGIIPTAAYLSAGWGIKDCNGEVVASEDADKALQVTGLTGEQAFRALGRVVYCSDSDKPGQRNNVLLSSIVNHGGGKPVPNMMIVEMVDGEPARTTVVIQG